MFFISILLFTTILISSTQSQQPALKLTFSPDQPYYPQSQPLDIQCELINPNDKTDVAQLWYVDLKTNKRTQISRSLWNTPTENDPDIFKQNKHGRLEYARKNSLRIRELHQDDSARFECDCPDCVESLGTVKKDLQVMKIVHPQWHVHPPSPIHEGAKTAFRCFADDFYPYVGHRIFRNHHDITKEGKSVVPSGDTFSQQFSWEATLAPTSDWHNTTIQCDLTEGSQEQHAVYLIEVIFAARFLQCDESQHVDSNKEKATISCSYSGNPAPTLMWLRQGDEKPITSDPGITIETKDEHHGKYKSIVTFDREKLVAIPLTTTTPKISTGPADTTVPPRVVGENYYQQLLNGGFLVKLNYMNEDKIKKKIAITGDATRARANIGSGSARATIEKLTASILFCSVLILTYIIQHH